MATVYKGVQVSLNRSVAIKILSKKMVGQSSILDRFNRESMIIAQLSHPNIIHVIDRGVTSNNMPYFVMEYVEGIDLGVAIKSDKLNLNSRLDLVIQICKALSYAHKNGVVHRDIKPANVLIDKERTARVLDFGIAQFYNEEHSDIEHTKPGTIMGTLAYMSPEQQVSSDNVTALSDLYSLGVIMYELFTGVKPSGRFRLPSEIDPQIPIALQNIIMACLETDPLDRPASADDIKDQLLKLLRGAHLKTDQKQRASLGITNIEDKFALLDVIREKPQGSVYLFENRANRNLMVIKSQPSSSSGYKEAKLLTSLRHRNIAKVLGTSKNENFFIVVMEYLSGGCLKDRMIKPHPVKQFIAEALQICKGLSFAHKNRVIHGNLRPSNVLYSDSGEIKVTDFGLDEHYSTSKDMVNWFNMNNEPKSVATDVRAAGVIFYQMLTGSLPGQDNSASPLSASFKKLPLKLQKVVAKMLAKDLSKRYKNFDEVIQGLKKLSVFGMDTVEMDHRALKSMTGTDEDITKTLPPVGPAGPVPVKRTLIQSFLLLFLLFVAAIFYVVQEGDVKLYMDFLAKLYEIILSYIHKIPKF